LGNVDGLFLEKKSVSRVYCDVWTNSHQLRDKTGRRDLGTAQLLPLSAGRTPEGTNSACTGT
jgi:hypothetical protein